MTENKEVSLDPRLVAYVTKKIIDIKGDTPGCSYTYYRGGEKCSEISELTRCKFCDKDICFLHINTQNICDSCNYSLKRYFKCRDCTNTENLVDCKSCYKKYCLYHSCEDCKNKYCEEEVYYHSGFGYYDKCGKIPTHQCCECLSNVCDDHYSHMRCATCWEEKKQKYVESLSEKFNNCDENTTNTTNTENMPNIVSTTSPASVLLKTIIVSKIILLKTKKWSCASCNKYSKNNISCEICNRVFCCTFNSRTKMCKKCKNNISKIFVCSQPGCSKISVTLFCNRCKNKYCTDHLNKYISSRDPYIDDENKKLCPACFNSFRQEVCGYHNCGACDVLDYCRSCQEWICESHWYKNDNSCKNCCWSY